MKKIGIIVNLNSRKYKIQKNNPYGVFEKIGGDKVIVKYTRSIEEIVDVAKEFKKESVDYIAPSGGDGTLHHIITQFSKVYKKNIPPLLILKGGTMNNVATSIQLKGDAYAILKRAVDTFKRGGNLSIVTRDTMDINGNHCFLFGNGLTADFLDKYYRIGKNYTKLTALIVNSIYAAFRNQNTKLFRGFDGTVWCDSVKLPQEHFLGILAGTVETIGMGFYPLFRANEKDGAFHVIVCSMKPAELAKNVIKLKNGRYIKHDNYFEKAISKLEIHAQEPFAYTMDGDLYHSNGTLTVSAGIPVQLVVV